MAASSFSSADKSGEARTVAATAAEAAAVGTTRRRALDGVISAAVAANDDKPPPAAVGSVGTRGNIAGFSCICAASSEAARLSDSKPGTGEALSMRFSAALEPPPAVALATPAAAPTAAARTTCDSCAELLLCLMRW